MFALDATVNSLKGHRHSLFSGHNWKKNETQQLIKKEQNSI